MNTTQLKLTLTTDAALTHADVTHAANFIAVNGQAAAAVAALNGDYTPSHRAELRTIAELNINVTVNTNEQDILEVMRKDRDEWNNVHEALVRAVKNARDAHDNKMADALRYSRDHADTMYQAASAMYDNVYAIIHPEG